MSTLTYYPPTGTQVTFGDDGPFTLEAGDLEGLLRLQPTFTLEQAVAQHGETFIGVTVPSRRVRMRTQLQGDTHEGVWDLREQLAGALWLNPTLPGARPLRGLLRLHRDGRAPVEVEAVGVVVGERWRAPWVCDLDIEWSIFDPRWRGLADSTVTLAAGGGWFGPLVGPFYSLGANISREVVNPGTAPAPFIARIYGVLDTPRLRLIETGEAIEVAGPVEADEHLLIDTSATDRRVRLVQADGSWVDATRRLNLDVADFFQLPPGLSTVRLEADDNPSGSVLITWRPRYAGV
jgi:hypothetical protein